MQVNPESLDLVYRGFKSVFSEAYMEAPKDGDAIIMAVPSSTREETYGWIGGFPNLREWIGQRQVQNLSASSFTIRNKPFDSTVAVPRADIADDRIGIYRPFFSEMGQATRRHKEELIFGLLKAGFTTACYDGQSFFDTDHPVVQADGTTVTAANTDGGSGPAWFLLDRSRAIRPIIFQTREDYGFQSLTESTNPHVFMHDEYIYGVKARVNVGFGLWQLARGSKQPLNVGNYAAARAAMMSFRGGGGKLLGVRPNVLIAPPALESDGLKLLNSEYGTGGVTNEWKGTARLIITPEVA